MSIDTLVYEKKNNQANGKSNSYTTYDEIQERK